MPAVEPHEPELVTRIGPKPRSWPAIASTVAFSAGFFAVLTLCRPVQEFLATRYIHGLGPIPLLVAAGLLLLPTPVAVCSAGRSPRRWITECAALALGITTTVFLLAAVDLRDRDDFAYMVLGATLAAAPVLRLVVGPALLRRWLRGEFERDLRGARVLDLAEAFLGRRVPDDLPVALARPDSALPDPVLWCAQLAGFVHRRFHGGPSLPTRKLLPLGRASLAAACDGLRDALRRRESPDLAARAKAVAAAHVAWLEINVLHRLADARGWPKSDDKPSVSAEDVLLADFELVYLLLLQASLHPSTDESIGAQCPAAMAALRWSLAALGAGPRPEHGAVGYLCFVCDAGKGSDGGTLVQGLDAFEGQLQADGASASRAEDLAVALAASRFRALDLYHWGLELLDGIEFSARELPLARYVRSLLHASLQEHHESMAPADRSQLQALAADDAVWADAPELHWEDGR